MKPKESIWHRITAFAKGKNKKENMKPEKIIKLNLGSGTTRYEGWKNVDFDRKCKPDYVANVKKLPFKDNSIDEIFASHILEHTTIQDDVLKEWERVLKPNGRITIAVPDLFQLLAEYRAGIIDLIYFTATIYGAKEFGKEWDKKAHTHCQVFTPDMLLERMRVYFRDVKPGAEGSPRPGCYGEVMAQGYKI